VVIIPGRVGLRTELSDYRAIDHHAPFGDPPLGFAPGSQSSMGENFLQALHH
jgi:hypothetical protein